MNKWIELIVGIILIVAPIFCALRFADWGAATLHLLMGGVIIVAVLAGILFFVLGISDIKG